MSNAMFQQQDPVSISVRPLNRGMMLDAPTGMIPTGGFITASNFVIGSQGPMRRPTLVELIDAVVDWPPIREAIQFWKADGSSALVVLDSKFVYDVNVGAGTFTGKYLKYAVGTVTVLEAGTAVTGAGGCLWLTDIKIGDVMVFEPGTANEDAKEIGSITDDTHLVLKQ